MATHSTITRNEASSTVTCLWRLALPGPVFGSRARILAQHAYGHQASSVRITKGGRPGDFNVALSWGGNTASLNAEKVSSPRQSVRMTTPMMREAYSHLERFWLSETPSDMSAPTGTVLTPVTIRFHPFTSHNIPIDNAIIPYAACSPMRSALC